MPYAEIESLGGTFHPHAIEVQDFAHYALIVDVRSPAEYDDDHIPGAVRLQAPWSIPSRDGFAGGSLPATLAAAVKLIPPDQPVLMYCGNGGLTSEPLAMALRLRGWAVDVLPGGWINYRRWVQAGLEVLPRLVEFRIIDSTLGSECARVLRALRETGHQALDVERIAGWRRCQLGAGGVPQPSQAWFESQLLHAIRCLDPRQPVWVSNIGLQLGSLSVPGALTNSLAIAPMMKVQAPMSERIKAWQRDEPMFGAGPWDLDRVLRTMSPNPEVGLISRWRQLAALRRKGLLSSLLNDFFDPLHTAGTAGSSSNRHRLPDFVVDSLAPRALAAAARARFPAAGETGSPG